MDQAIPIYLVVALIALKFLLKLYKQWKGTSERPAQGLTATQLLSALEEAVDSHSTRQGETLPKPTAFNPGEGISSPELSQES